MAQNNAVDQKYPIKTHLFTVRLWQTGKNDGQSEIRGKVQHVLSGEVGYFGDWASLQKFLVNLSREAKELPPE